MWLLLLLVGIAAHAQSATVEFDFEDADPGMPTKSNVDSSSTSVLARTPDRYKHGEKSLKWQWSNGVGTNGEQLKWNLVSKNIVRRAVREGGIKLHVYSTIKRSGECLRLCVVRFESKKPRKCRTDPSPPYTSCFHMSLDFKGWSAVWISYREFRGCPDTTNIPADTCFQNTRSKLRRFTIQAPHGSSSSSDPIYIDYLRFVDDMEDETRDNIVPPLMKSGAHTSCYECSNFNSITQTDAVKRHGATKFWHQAFRWNIKQHAATPSSSISSLPLPTTDQEKEMRTIKARLLAWYAQKDTSFFDLVWPNKTSTRVSTRWSRFLKAKDPTNCMSESGTIECAHKIFHDLQIDTSTLKGPGLFCRNSDHSTPNNETFFHDIFHKVMVPMAVEYYIWSNVEKRACVLTEEYHCSLTDKTGLKDTDLDALIGKDTSGSNSLEEKFTNEFGNTKITPSSTTSTSCSPEKEDCIKRFRDAIKEVQKRRKDKILLLFKYVRNQGFMEGSSLGSLGHQMLVGSGYMHAAFLMADAIKASGSSASPILSLQNVLDTMKWYTDFGEVYQDTPYEYKGTTADRVRTYMVFRLLTVLSMPEDDDDQKREKFRDFKKVKNWIDNALSVNEGTLGLIKPDFTGFHHQFFYGGAYTPGALHAASLVSYLLGGQATFQLSDTSTKNIENGLKVLRMIAVKYSTPSSVNGRYPDYKKSQLGYELPAFAYISVVPPNLNTAGALEAITSLNSADSEYNAKMFKRLLPPSSTSLCPAGTNLCNAKASAITFTNTLGAAQIVDKTETLATAEENSPKGNWVKNYAALSIHRRDDWAVTVKGFNYLVYDPERYVGENEYGLFGANGAILIANSEEALKTKDVNGGWDWRKIPGTTTVAISDADIKKVKGSRNSNKKSLAGGVSFRGKNVGDQTKSNGVFGMDFEMPDYNFKSASHSLNGKTFKFKKSVFFFDDVLVCLGTGITSTASEKVTTALFQDKVVSPASTSGSSTSKFYCNENSTKLEKDNFSGIIQLIDRHGNKYYIPSTVSDDLVLKRRVTQSFMRNKGNRLGSGDYCTAWIDHGASPTDKSYKYFVKVNAVPSPHSHSADTGTFDVSVYNVLQNDDKVHTVKKTITSDNYICGYVVFDATATLDAACPLQETDTASIMMVEKTSTHLYISVSYPQMNLKKQSVSTDITDINPDFCTDSLPPLPSGAADTGTSLLFCAGDDGVEIKVKLRTPPSGTMAVTSVVAGGQRMNAPSVDFDDYAEVESDGIRFYDLKHGKTIEVGLSL